MLFFFILQNPKLLYLICCNLLASNSLSFSSLNTRLTWNQDVKYEINITLYLTRVSVIGSLLHSRRSFTIQQPENFIIFVLHKCVVLISLHLPAT